MEAIPGLAVLRLLHLAELHVRLVLEVLPGVHGAMVQWCSGALVQWCSGLKVQWCSAH